ncbi:ClpP/crotonase [Patellaria atrata CBS 101060]|uniref:ClpP/crotonase n=1 Tax=Patellaria atrata CBS 101060 TaxID=1346257 RepID=A0A9P4VN59_9PEZI|nr:ClpP/crotonase [Patellaria atrata CBS 101060]
MPNPPPDISPPPSYTTLPLTTLKLSHHPLSSPTATPIVIVSLSRPGAHNAFTNTMMLELEQVYSYFDVDDRVRCIVLTGEGRIFCAGADLTPEHGFKGGLERVNDHRDGGGRIALAIHNCRKPTIGALQGSAVGIGITMTLPMSIRIAYSAAKIGFVFARRGLVMEACSSFFLPRLISFSRAMHLITTGATYRADDKLLENLFSETLDSPDKVLPRALEIAEEVAKNTSTVSTYLMKEMMYRDTGSPEGQHLLDSKILYDLFQSPDNKEGVRAFLEKRDPKFSDTVETFAPDAYPWWEPVDVLRRAKPKGYAWKPKL